MVIIIIYLTIVMADAIDNVIINVVILINVIVISKYDYKWLAVCVLSIGHNHHYIFDHNHHNCHHPNNRQQVRLQVAGCLRSLSRTASGKC